MKKITWKYIHSLRDRYPEKKTEMHTRNIHSHNYKNISRFSNNRSITSILRRCPNTQSEKTQAAYPNPHTFTIAFWGRWKKKKKKLTNIITHEKIVGVRSLAAYPEQLDEIIELTMNISAHGDRTFHRLHIPFLHQNRSSLITKRPHLRLRQRLALHQVLYLSIQIRVRRHFFPPNFLLYVPPFLI